MAKLVECVPNFSEGNNKEVIDALGQAISRTPGCVLLDVDAGASTNRTVYTFVGSPEAVVEAALSAARVAGQLIDMSQHTVPILISAPLPGEHPRMGALDVCPFVPVMNVSMEECVTCANIFGQRLAAELGVPVYLYGEAAREESRKALPTIRAGEYEALPEKLAKPEWAPDFGPSTFVPRWGATVTGARTFLIAYNVNLLCTKEQAHRIALNIREQGRGADQPGRLKRVQGIGWYLEEENIAQVSTNLLDFETTPLHVVYEEVCRDAEKAMLDTAEFYIKKEKLFILEEEQKIRLGAALGCMVGLMSYGKRQFEELDPIMRKLIPPFHQAMDELVAMVDADSRAFSSYMVRRTAAMQQGLKTAVRVPCALAEKVSGLWPALKDLACHCNLACKSDIQVGAKMLEAAVFGAYFNVMINLKDIKDEKFKLAVHPEGCHHHKSKFAHLLLQDALVPALQQVPTLATLPCHLATLEPVPQDTQVAIPVAPLRLAPARRGITRLAPARRGITRLGPPSQGITRMGTTLMGITPQATTIMGITPMGTPIQDHRGAHHAPLAAMRSTTRSIRRNTRSSTMEASTPAAAPAAVLTQTEDDISHLHSSEVMRHETRRPTRNTCMLLLSFPLPLRVAF
ncbi:Ftcd [Columba livia]|nr:Ftcd [Columba livia]